MTGGPADRGADDVDDEQPLAVVYRLPTGRAPGAAESNAPTEFGVDRDSGSAVGVDDVPADANGSTAPAGAAEEDGGREDWVWVREWRAGHEPTPWVTGVPLAVFSAVLVAVAVWVLSAGLSDRPVVAVLVNLLVAGGLTPAMWLSRNLPVLRWIAAGAAAGIVIGWVSAILMLPLPA